MEINSSHPRFVDISGQRFGQLVAVEIVDHVKSGYIWRCQCDCGNETRLTRGKLSSGHTKSCGCLIDEGRRARATHRMTKTPEHNAWLAMRGRCHRPSDRRFKYYGGRGIVVCDEWRKDFNAFFAYIGPRPTSEHSIDRIEVDGNYEPGNVRWAVKLVQLQNKRSVRKAMIDGVEKPVSEWARQFGINPKLVVERMRSGWDIRRALTTDPKLYHNNY